MWKRSTLVVSLALGLGAPIGIAQNQDCGCAGSWVETYNSGPNTTNYGPSLVESFQTVECESYSVPQHSHSALKIDFCSEAGGSCSTLSWRSELQTLYDNSGLISITVPNFTIPPGFEAREEKSHKTDSIAQDFQCQVSGVPVKTLSRSKVIGHSFEISVKFVKLRDCNEEEPG
jgi:hypothetical protein